MSFWFILAQTNPAQARGKLIIALGILMALVLIGGVGILFLRRKLYTHADEDNSADVGFSLSDLRRMRDRGEITPAEYEVTRNRVIAKVRSSLEGKDNKKSPLENPEDQ